MRRSLAQILVFAWLALMTSTAAAETNYFCVVCGKGPLVGRVWLCRWGAVCTNCYQLENHCSICGLPIAKDFAKTGDGRYICKFDRPNAVLDQAEAKDVFAETRRELIELFGRGFALQYPDVTVNLFDVDYWSEHDATDGLHKFGFANTRTSSKGACTHEIILLSGRLRNELKATVAHEYTHLWINENRQPDRKMDGDTLEAICELVAYKLMESDKFPDQQQRILKNPYTHGVIKTLLAIEAQRGMGYIFNWVKTGTASNFTDPAAGAISLLPVTVSSTPVLRPKTLSFTGISIIGNARQAIINGMALGVGETKEIPLLEKTITVHCRAISEEAVTVFLDGATAPVTLPRVRKAAKSR